MEEKPKKDFIKDLAELITENPVPSLMALVVSVFLFKESFLLGIIGFVFVFGIFYLRQNAFNPIAKTWIRIGGIIIFIIWIISLYLRSKN